ncbi:1-deoxy-D-xylulose-5-phosphate synthase [Blochmannia endosymbiont of Camponotus (Colobopsis) obliquus]|uniref:1-deoxy-D-xylulose-5-phosphate synthase n=1 Tax=Blochmannia endosymbiont of Camponotus (Colobopsis) obliquus TaxID=1505597 RepID=UPI00061A81B7|nr:1-deoxy-D-xylulose-5-phosphate synthase [Blochmannia endosymbiont of Camponotus (Colobopsis) obliquus]AKC60401.1 1-deoxy-D-xylulose-5-phosphate synthase [Blochmannia endosymbiont of Camponotus (Colobopsis) obliquus]
MKFNNKKYPTLSLINNPMELRKLPQDALSLVCTELRQFLLDTVSQSSGHFASGLGVIELTVALHYVYNTPFDHLIWDVGHQAYPHKILTGRRDKIFTIRQYGGLHPFPCRNESKYDILSVGHSSTSISAALGLAIIANREMLGRQTVSVIGDGAISAGMAFEAMNHAGYIKCNLLVILNDNEMSISKNVGALNNYLTHILSGKFYSKIRKNSKKILSKTPYIKKIIQRIEEHIINTTISKNLFKELGFNYIGPINGHDISTLIQTLKNIQNMQGPQFLHIITKKGYGYKPAEKDPITWHAVPKFDPSLGLLPKNNNQNMTYSAIFGNWLCNIAANDNKLIVITPAMREGSGLNFFSKKYPNQYFDVAIAEQHAVTFAAGLAIGGYKPIVAIYSTFLQRAYDQVIHDIALQKLPVLFAVDRGGIVGPDGQTHQGAFDLSYLRCIPNIIIMTPSDENECRLMLHTGYHYKDGPTIVRYPREIGTGAKFSNLYKLPISKGMIHRQGTNIAILNFGTLLAQTKQVASDLNATLIDMRFVKPLDEILINNIVKKHNALITVEENAIIGGAGSGVNEFLMKEKILIPVLNIGLPDRFIAHGSRKDVLYSLGLDSIGIYKKIKAWLK